jgi:hydroxymethylpyrimidine/phosphomethylpyrimidine kinase
VGLDPVMVAATGARLISEEAVDVLAARLLPRATVVTPNLPEAAVLLAAERADTREAMAEQARALVARGAGAALVKGGHGGGPEAADVLATADGASVWLAAPRHETRNTHGTGCTLSSAIAAGLAKGEPLEAAVRAAKDYLTAALVAADGLAVGHGHGPVHHFHAFWPPA